VEVPKQNHIAPAKVKVVLKDLPHAAINIVEQPNPNHRLLVEMRYSRCCSCRLIFVASPMVSSVEYFHQDLWIPLDDNGF